MSQVDDSAHYQAQMTRIPFHGESPRWLTIDPVRAHNGRLASRRVSLYRCGCLTGNSILFRVYKTKNVSGNKSEFRVAGPVPVPMGGFILLCRNHHHYQTNPRRISGHILPIMGSTSNDAPPLRLSLAKYALGCLTLLGTKSST